MSANEALKSFERKEGSESGEVDSLDGFDYELTKSGDELETYISDIADTVRITIDQSINILTPWFFSNMPDIYYQATPRAEKVKHLCAIITGNIFESKQVVEIWDKDKEKVTFIGPGEKKNIAFDIAGKLKNISPNLGFLYFSHDNLLFIATFFCKPSKKIQSNNAHVQGKIDQTAKMLTERAELKKNGNFDHFIKHLDYNTVKYATPERLILTYEMLSHMLQNEGAHTILSQTKSSKEFRITLGIKGLRLHEILDQVIMVIESYDFGLVRYFVKEFKEGYSHTINVFHFVLSASKKGEEIDEVERIKLIKALKTLAWIDSDEYTAFSAPDYGVSPNGVNLIRSIATWVHVLLGKENAYYYSEHKIFKTFKNHFSLTEELLVLFRLKFDPRKSKERANKSFEAKREELTDFISKLMDRVERNIFKESLTFIDSVLKTNYFIPTKTGLAFRLDPEILDKKHYNQTPFGIFYIVGKNYRFFHVRWKDVARGGLRIILPRTETAYAYAKSGLFDEVYGLSYAQQLKNKDIPEGGSKAVLLIKPKADHERALKGAVNAFLDLLVAEDEEHEDISHRVVSYYEPEEIIYLGPDENMTNDLITWTQEQAEKRAYKYYRAFMSSKPKDGINHKEYGVTSEGLHVYVEHVLKRLGIDAENQSFTVKMTGGPDGDVAGNELKILHRKYEKTCKVVAIADGFGAAYDPNGLDWSELMRLTKEEKSIVHFKKEKLTKGTEAFLIGVDSVEEIEKRNKLHSHVKADILIPAGGRPYTVNENNAVDFVLEDGLPSCKAIVEGANIFFTDKARDFLQEQGVLIIKDSSANKTGVICSSFEIISSLVLEQEEFLLLKETYVKEVIEILRERAHQEARLLFKEKDSNSKNLTLTELSKKLSSTINSITDGLLENLTKEKDFYLKDAFFKNLVLRHCPPVLQEKFSDSVIEKLPDMYKIAMVASYCASFVVYTEGLKWISSFSKEEQFKAVMTYMKSEVIAQNLSDDIKKTDLKNKEKILKILEKSGAKALTNLSFES